MINKSAQDLHLLTKRILVAAGADDRNAEDVAEHLVLANLSGVDSHGVWHLLGYVRAIQDGLIVPTAWPDTLRETPGSALVSGNWTFGQPAAKFAMRLAIDKARQHDIAIVGVVQKHHIGRLGHYTEMAADEGMVSIVCAGGQGQVTPATMPFGGASPVLHTNPLAAGFPTSEADRPMMFDFATSCTSGVKIINARNRNQKMPHGYIVDKMGKPTDDPEQFFDGGGHAPFGGHKGYAIMMMVEYLGRILCGSNALADDRHGGPILRNEGCSMIVFKADLFQAMDAYIELAEEMGRRVRDIPPADGFQQVMMPGDPESAARANRSRDGIPIEKDIWSSMLEAGNLVGMAVE